ncbi:MAG: periplasmic oligopeptide-binding protein [Pseudomonadota bacterium]|jgi:oligopeptide transport system substrate-binding protein
MRMVVRRFGAAAIAVGMVAGAVLSALAGPAAAQTAAGEMVIRIGNGGDPETLDPHRITSITGDTVVLNLCEGLVAFDAGYNAVPGLAESWTTSADGKTWTFTLREGLKWSDGTPFTAEDYVWSLRRSVTPATIPGFPEFLYSIENAQAIVKGEMPPESLGVSSPDPRTIVFRLWRPFPDFLTFGAAQRGMYPLQRAAVERHGAEFTRPGNFHCTGPFILDEAVPQSHMRLVRNPHYWDAANVKPDVVYYYASEDSNTEVRRFRAGELHLTNTVPATQLDWLRANMPDSLKIVQGASTYYYMPNLKNAPWKDNPKLRTALAMAIDREGLTRGVTRGGEVPAYTVVPPGLKGYVPARPEWADWSREKQVAEAKRLYAEAGFGPGKPLQVEILYNTLERHRQIAVAVAAMWKQILGVEVTLNNVEWKVLLEIQGAKTYKDMVRRTWISTFPFSHLDLLRGTAQPAASVGYANPEFDRLMAEADAIPDRDAYYARMRQAEALAVADMAIIPVMHDTQRRLADPRLRGFIPNGAAVHPAKFMWLEE